MISIHSSAIGLNPIKLGRQGADRLPVVYLAVDVAVPADVVSGLPIRLEDQNCAVALDALHFSGLIPFKCVGVRVHP
jgi:hypothetical protein